MNETRAIIILGDICDNCAHKSSQTKYSATCTKGNNKGRLCLDVQVCGNYLRITE